MFEPIDRVMNMRKGGSAVAPRRTVIAGQDHMLSYITPQEGEILMALGGSGRPGPMGIPSFNPGGDGYVAPVTSYRVPIGTFGGSPDDMQYQTIRIGSDQDTMENRMAGSADLANQTQGTAIGSEAVNKAEYMEQFYKDLEALQGRPSPIDTVADPDPDPDPDPVAPVNPSDVIVDPVDVMPDLANIGGRPNPDDLPPPFDPVYPIIPGIPQPTAPDIYKDLAYKPFRPDFTSPSVLSIEDVMSMLPPRIPISTYQPFDPDFTPDFGPSGFKSFAQGGAVEAPRRTDIQGQDHMLSYITPDEADILMALGGSGEAGPMGIPAFRSGPGDMGAGSGDVGTEGEGMGEGQGGDGMGGGAPGGAPGGGGSSDDNTGEEAGGYEEASAPSGYDFGFSDTSVADRAAAKDYGVDSYGQPVGRGAMGYAGSRGMSPGRSQAMFGTDLFAGLNIGSQKGYNERMGITDTNPFGKMGFFTRHFGIDPKNVDYTGIMSLNTRRAIANNQFSKFANPQNIRGAPGYNPAFATAKPGQLRAGVQKAGYDTKFGKVVERNREMEVPEMIARGLFSLAAPGFMGLALSQMGTKEYGLPSLPGMERFGVKEEPPGLAGQIFGAITGGVPADQAYDKAKSVVGDLVDRMSSKDIEAVAKATPEQQQEIQENIKASSTQGFSQPDIFDFSPTTTSSVSGSFSDLTADQKIGVISAEQQARANAATTGKDLSTAGSVARARAIADALRGNQ